MCESSMFFFSNVRHKKKHYAIDNEINSDLCAVIKKVEMILELTPPGIHCRNVAEKRHSNMDITLSLLIGNMQQIFPNIRMGLPYSTSKYYTQFIIFLSN